MGVVSSMPGIVSGVSVFLVWFLSVGGGGQKGASLLLPYQPP